jgi:hypothetical protein
MEFTGRFATLPTDISPLRIREMKLSPLILVKADGAARYASGRTDKDALIAAFADGEDLLLFPWVGKWTTDVFRLTREDLQRHYDAPQT